VIDISRKRNCKKVASINVFLFQLSYSGIYGWGVACANAFQTSCMLSADPATDKLKQKAILGAVFASVPHYMFLFIMIEVMLKEHQQLQNPQLPVMSAEEMAANLNEAVAEEDGSVQEDLPQ